MLLFFVKIFFHKLNDILVNDIGCEGIQLIAKSLKINKTLKKLDIGCKFCIFILYFFNVNFNFLYHSQKIVTWVMV